MKDIKKYIAEFIGTLVLVFFGTGVAAITGVNLLATALAFGLAIIADAYVIGEISGCHVNPAVSFAMLLSKKMTLRDFGFYVLAQVLGALAGTTILYLILKGTYYGVDTLGANGFGTLSTCRIDIAGAIMTEIIMTFVFVFAILGVTSDKKNSSIAGIVIGLTLTFVHIFGIRLTGTSVNPARSLAPAIFQGGEALKQVWLFIISPMIGGALAAYLYQFLNNTK